MRKLGMEVWFGKGQDFIKVEQKNRKEGWRGENVPPPQSWVSKKNLVDWELRVEEKLGEVRGHRCAGHR